MKETDTLTQIHEANPSTKTSTIGHARRQHNKQFVTNQAYFYKGLIDKKEYGDKKYKKYLIFGVILFPTNVSCDFLKR